jgi:hypothetical protein
LKKWKKYIIDNYIKNLKLCCLDKQHDYNYIKLFDFTEEELKLINSEVKLESILETDKPLLYLLESGRIDFVVYILHSNYLKFDINETDQDKTLFISFVGYYLSQPPEDFKENYLDFEDRILLLFRRGYAIKNEDKDFIIAQKHISDPRHLKHLLFASYALKLNNLKLIYALRNHMDLITCLACLKNDINIGNYKTLDLLIKATIRWSDYQNEIIDYIKKTRKTQYDYLAKKLTEERRSISEKITDPNLRVVLKRLFI